MLLSLDHIWLAMGCITMVLGAIHLSIWWRQRSQVQHGAFALLAFSVAASATTEWLALNAQTAADFAYWFRWTFATMLPVIAVMVFLVRTLGAGRPWLAIGVVGTRVATTLANFLTGDCLGYVKITALRPIPLWGGETVAGPIGELNPWLALGQFSNLLLLAFLVDALVSLARRPPTQRSRALRIALALIAVVAAVLSWNLPVMLYDLALPMMVAPMFVALVMAMSFELGTDILRAAQLADTLRLAESDLSYSRHGLQLAERAAGLGLWRWDARQDQVWLSDRGARILGLGSAGTYPLRQLVERMDRQDRDAVGEALERARRDRVEEFSIEFRLHADAGSPRWVAAYGQFEPATTAAGPVIHGVIFDVTERRSAEQHFRLVVDAAPTAMLLLDADSGNVLLANAAAASLSGYAIAELTALSIDALVPDKQRDAHRGLRAAYIGAASRRQMQPLREVQLKRKDASNVSVEIALSPVRERERMLVIAAINDVSERKAKDRELAIQRDALAHLSRVELLSELSGSLAHELNQPLAAILSNAQASVRFLNREPPDLGEVREGLAQIIDSDKRAGEIIRRLRAMLRKDTSNFVPLNLNEVVHDVLQIARGDLIDRNVLLHEDLAKDAPAISGDRVQLQQVILNLIRNASDAMRELPEGRELTLTTRTEPGGVLLQVADVGHGIPEADLERIFAPFVSSKTDGLGLGLSLCASLVKAHDGRLWASNNADRGATFHVFLPALVTA